MNAQEFTALADQVARQTPELSAYDADIAGRQPTVDALQSAADAAQAALDVADEAGKPVAQDALSAALSALAQPKSELDALKLRAEAIRSAIAQCQSALDESGLTVDTAAVKLAEAKAVMWGRIKAHRDHLSDTGGYTAAGKWFHSDLKSKGQQQALVMLGANVPAVQWKTMDGSFITMTQTLAGQIFAAAVTQDSTIFAVAESHRVAMEASADPLAYDYSSGWPAIYGA